MENKELEKINSEVEKIDDKVEILDNRQVEMEEVILRQMSIRSAPLPPPEELEHYERIMPGLAMEIVEMAKISQNRDFELVAKEQEARIKNDEKIIEFETTVKSRDSVLGMVSGIIIVIIAFSFSTYLAMNDKTVVASIIAGTTLVTIFTSLIINTRVKNNEKKEEFKEDSKPATDISEDENLKKKEKQLNNNKNNNK